MTDYASILQRLIKQTESGIALLESAEKDTNWGQPTFGPTYSEEAAAELEALREELAGLFIHLSGKTTHASDCSTSQAPAYMPGPCDCEVAS